MTANETAPTEKRIRDYLAERIPDAADLRLADIEQIAVGWSHETWLFDARWNDGDATRAQGFCLRRDPGNALLRDLSDLAVQFRVLRCLEPTPVPTPKPYWYEADPSILGASVPRDGEGAGHVPQPVGPRWSPLLRGGRRPRRAAGQLHRRAGRPPHPRLAGRRAVVPRRPRAGTDFARREVAKWRSLIERTQHDPEPILTDLIGWLEANAPDHRTPRPRPRRLPHRQPPRRGDRISAVLDWELEVIGDPMYDVAYVLSDLNREGTDLLSNLVDRDDFYRDYEAATGIEIDDDACRYYQLLYAMRSVAFWMSASDLYATGRSRDLRLARTQWSIPVVLERAARDLGY